MSATGREHPSLPMRGCCGQAVTSLSQRNLHNAHTGSGGSFPADPFAVCHKCRGKFCGPLARGIRLFVLELDRRTSRRLEGRVPVCPNSTADRATNENDRQRQLACSCDADGVQRRKGRSVQRRSCAKRCNSHLCHYSPRCTTATPLVPI